MRQRLFRIALFFLMITIAGLGCEREHDWSSDSALGEYLGTKLSKENSGRDCHVGVSTFKDKVRIITIEFKSEDGYSINALKKLKTGGPYDVMIYGPVKTVPDLSKTQIVTLLFDTNAKTDLSKLAMANNLENLNLNELTRRIFDRLPTLQVARCALGFSENVSLTSADLLKFPKLKELSLGSSNATVTITPEQLEKWPALTSLTLWGDCAGYEHLQDLPGLEQLILHKSTVNPEITPEKLAHFKSVIFNGCIFSSPAQQQEIEKLSNVKILIQNNH